MIGRKFVGVVGLATLSASAWAQDYTYEGSNPIIEVRPAGATRTNISLSTGMSVVALPFEFPYYGKPCSTLAISPHGCVVPGATSGFLNDGNPTAAHGQNATSGTFPYGAGTNSADGVVAPCWSNYKFVNDGSANTGYVYTWTTGTAPTRHFVVSWENVAIQSTSNPRLTVQVKLYEGTGQIAFAYSNHGDSPFSGATWVFGIDSPIDSRYTGFATVMTNAGIHGDYVFDPRTVTYTGTVLYDRIVSDATGIGNSVQNAVAAAGCQVELRRASDNFTHAAVPIAADGTFSLRGVGVPSSPPGTIAFVAANPGCSVGTTAGGAPTTFASFTSVSMTSNAAFGTTTIDTSADPNGDLRAAIDVARACGAAYTWASARTSDAIPRLDVLLDPSSSAATLYQQAGAQTPSLRVGSRGSTNPDAGDAAIVTRTYARHVLFSIAPPTTTTPDYRFDAVTDTQNAFAEAFGYYLWAAVSGASQAIDATGASTATTYDLEIPAISVAKGPAVAGSMAGALYDLVDAANETTDPVDGTAAADHLFHAVDTLTVVPIVSNAMQAWIDAGYDAPGITRVFVAHKVLADDASEPNDDRTEAAVLGDVGVRRSALVLNRFNEDWYAVTLPEAATSLVADATYDRVSLNSVVAVEIRDAGGALLAMGSGVGPTGPIRATANAVPAGSYRIGVRHVSGVSVPTYTVQSYVPLVMDAVPLSDWTVGRAFDKPLGVAGGIAPYTLSTGNSAMPPGLALSPLNQHAIGTPTTPGAYAVTIELRDDGNPANVQSRTQDVTIHDVLKIGVAAYVGFPSGRAVDTTLPTIEGTPPFSLAMPSGALPAGLTLEAGTFHVTGTADAQAASAFELDAVDIAGSSDHVATRGVVAVELNAKNVPAALGAGDDACGWWFDAVQGSKVSFKAKTAKGAVKRVVTGMALAPDRSEVTTATVKGKLGGLSVSKLVCPQSGRYYVIAASTDGAATQLLGSVAVAPPKSGKAKLSEFTPGDTTTVEFGALPGAVLTLKFKGDKTKDLIAKVATVYDDDGVGYAFGPNVTTSGVGGTLEMTLAKGGTWRVTLTATGETPGKLSYSYKLAQPKDASYSAD